jgi:hypothetical protein
MSLYDKWFAIAGLIAAAGPVIIHLLNRRRYRTISWAAMDFLREAVLRSRRILHIRDLLLMALRMLCLAAFGLALAQPRFGSTDAGSPDDPVHAVLLVDNSLSMGYKELDGTLLDKAKAKAKEVIDGLPTGSRISVLPTCGPAGRFSYDAYYSKSDAQEALARIEPVDRQTTPRETIDMAREACNSVPTMGTKQIMFLTDQQVLNWPVAELAEDFGTLPGKIRFEEVRAGGEVQNAWVADLKLREAVADLGSQPTFIATIGYQGRQPRKNVRVTLTIDGQKVAEVPVDLPAGENLEVTTKEVRFDEKTAPYRFKAPAGSEQMFYAAAEVSISPDALPGDDRRALVFPVLARLPVLFVDQYGSGKEDRRGSLFGETYFLRRLLAIATNQTLRMARFDHRRIEDLDVPTLQDARMVVIAGAASPGSEATVRRLREYVEQGGNLIVAAGAQFNPEAWNRLGWADGKGILPARLAPDPIGQTPDRVAGDNADVFFLDFDSLRHHEYFALESETDETKLRDLYTLPPFFKAVRADVGNDVQKMLLGGVVEELKERRRNLKEIGGRLADLDLRDAKGTLSDNERREREELRHQRGRFEANWLRWASAEQHPDDERAEEDIAADTKPVVLARYTNKEPYMIQRRLGHGRVLFVTSGLYFSDSTPGWNMLMNTDAAVVFDRIMRQMLQVAFPERNMSTQQQLVLPVSPADREGRFVLVGPERYGKTQAGVAAAKSEPLSVGALGANRYGLTIGQRVERGIYRVQAAPAADGLTPDPKPTDILLAVNGPAKESELLVRDETRLRKELEGAASLGLERADLHQSDLWWKILVWAVLALLLAEIVILAWPALSTERTA